ncbi:MAG: ribosome biogenesis GTP-binding protein YihA/YsxC, partial [Gammaproteobacteria bacterium]|nr:ribosome biogenesis GTP-binding protein YihA/YsxC [Gammaproteobacteria bacterium]
MIHFQQATFLKSAAKVSQFPEDIGSEVAFVGRSNAGKSSALNALTCQKKLARVSGTPGRTQLINFFNLTEEVRLVDLPGYGYAAVPKAVKNAWHVLIDKYLTTRKSLKGLVLLMDIRHPLQTFEQEVLEWCSKSHLLVHVLLTKADKLSNSAARTQLDKVAQQMEQYGEVASIQLFSAIKKRGIEELREK